MPLHIDVEAVAPEILQPLRSLGRLQQDSGLDRKLITLVDLHASQLNGCAFCLALHRREGQALGDTLDRIAGVSAWRESPWYSEKERAALAWTEALTRLGGSIPPELASELRSAFSDREIAYLTAAIITINGFNRLAIGLGASPERAEEVFTSLFPDLANK